MEQYKVNLSDNVLVEVATMENRYSYHVAPLLTYHLYPNHPWSDGQILNEREFKLGVRCLAPCEGECIVTGCLYQYVYAFPIQSKERDALEDQPEEGAAYLQPQQSKEQSQEELWEDVFKIYLSCGDVYMYDSEAAINLLKEKGFTITKTPKQ